MINKLCIALLLGIIMSKKTAGFTLIELIVTLAIAAILVTWGIPSFTQLIRTNRITAQTNEFVTTVNLARSEAVRRGATVNLVSSGGTNWEDGWQLQLAATGEILRQSDALDGTTTLASTVNNTTAFAFDSRGYSDNIEVLQLCDVDTAEGRQISIAGTGRISVSTITTCP